MAVPGTATAATMDGMVIRSERDDRYTLLVKLRVGSGTTTLRYKP